MTPRDIIDTPVEEIIRSILEVALPILAVYMVLQVVVFVWIWRKTR